jgi:hypothetical protein
VARTLALATAILAAASPASAGVLADFLAQPASPITPEFIWNGFELFNGSGSIGDGFGVPGAGDGDLPLASQAVPGLLASTPFTVPGVSGGQVNTSTGATMFFNATLQIVPISPATQGFPGSGPAGVAYGRAVQPLGNALFNLWTNDPAEAVADIENPVLLLSGIASSAVITGLLGSSTGTTLSASVTYTGGAILTAAGWPMAAGEFSWSLLDIAGPLQVDTRTGMLRPFVANGVGQFSGIKQVPEPTTLAVLVIGTAVLAFRRRRK